MRLGALVLILLGSGSLAEAQEAWLSATVGQSTHALFSRPAGIAGGITLPLRGALAFRVSYNLLDHTSSRFARACGGLIPPPPACPEEWIDDATALRGLSFGLVTEVSRRQKATLALIPMASVAGVRSTGRGRQTGNSIRASEPLLGFGGEAQVSYRPSPRWPVALHASAQLSWLGSVVDASSDGYAPFSEGLRLTRVDLGVSIGRRRRP